MRCKKIILILGLLSGVFGFYPFVGAVLDNTGIKLEVMCNLNGICEPALGENWLNCAGDCPLPLCNNDGVCESERGENEDNCPLDCASATPMAPVAATSIAPGSPGQWGLAAIYDIAVADIASLSARITWKTDIDSRCQLTYGENSKYALGTVSEFVFTKNHRAALAFLTPETDYFFRIVCANSANRVSEVENQKFTTLSLADSLPPANVVDFWAEAAGESIDLEWSNPKDGDFAGVRILRSEIFYPTDLWSGEVVYDGKGQSFRDEGLESGKTYYYTAFAYDRSRNYSSGAVAGAIPGQFGKKSEIPEIAAPPEIRKIDLSNFEFHQNGEKIAPRNGEVKISRYQPFSMSIAYEDVPEVLKTIMVTLEKGNEAFSFLLRLNKEKTLYTATLVPPDTGVYPLNIMILDYKNRAFKKIGAKINVFKPESAIPVKTYEYLVIKKAPLIIYIIIIVLAVAAAGGAYRAAGKHFKKARNSNLESN